MVASIKKFDINYYIRKSLCGLEECYCDKNPNYIFYKKNNEIIFEYNVKNKHFWCSYSNFWHIFNSKLLYVTENEIMNIFKSELKTILNIENPTIVIGDVYNKRFCK